ncbi:MAG: sensor histidine kinase [Bellilinea sp.]
MNPDPAQTSLELLLNISRELATSLDLPTVLERVLYHATQAVNAERGSLIALAANGQPVEAVMVVNGQRHHLSRLEVSDILDHGLAGWVASQREPVLVENTLEDERWQHRPDDDRKATGAKSTVCVPLMAQDQLTGVLTLVHAQPGFFNDQHLQLAQAIAGLAGMAVRNAHLFESAQEAQRRYRELFEDSIDPILLTNWEGQILAENRQAAHVFGSGAKKLIGLSVLDLHAAPLDRLGEDFAVLKEGSTLSYESRLHALDGSTIPIEAHVRRVQLGSEALLQWILRDIRERKQLDALRDDLMAMIYHDLRSPLANIISSLDILSTMLPEGGDESLETVVQIATRSADRLQRLIGSLLDIYRLESGQALVKKGELNPAQMVAECVEAILPLAKTKALTLTTSLPGDLPLLTADYDMIRRVYINLLENSIKFTPIEGAIEGGCAAGEGVVNFWVKDNGIGIPEEARERIFDKYSRLQTDRYPRGMGLGLAFCRLAVQAHGGKIWVESKPDEGSTFVFTLPVTA